LLYSRITKTSRVELIAMKDPVVLSLTCRYCQHYQPEGRRGGHCHRLEAMVDGQWQACSLAIPAFAMAPEQLQPLLETAEITTVSQPLSYVDYPSSYTPTTLAFRLQTSNLE
jgi:hypothetical protein